MKHYTNIITHLLSSILTSQATSKGLSYIVDYFDLCVISAAVVFLVLAVIEFRFESWVTVLVRKILGGVK